MLLSMFDSRLDSVKACPKAVLLISSSETSYGISRTSLDFLSNCKTGEQNSTASLMMVLVGLPIMTSKMGIVRQISQHASFALIVSQFFFGKVQALDCCNHTARYD